MKKKPLFIPALLSVLSVLNCACTVSAANYSLSPALEMMSENVRLVKNTVMTKELKFSREDFEQTLGKPIEYITVTNVPDSSAGVLRYAGADVREDHKIPAKNIGLLKFTPARNVGSASFTFTADGNDDLSAECTINVLEKQNDAPVGESLETGAISGIGLIKNLNIYDPDGDNMSIEIAEFPENGVVKLCGSGFMYTALPGYSGEDSFSYSVRDSFGNISKVSTVTLDVREPETDTRYSDMTGHWGYTSALAMTELGLMKGEKDGKKLCFNPDEAVTTGDFIAMAMISAGLEEKIKPNAQTTFADDGDIPANIRSYAAYAQTNEVFKGKTSEDGKTVFGSDDTITRAEAANVLANLLGNARGVNSFEFTDAASIPDWAKDSFASLVSLGIINGSPEGTLEPQRYLTRAEAAQLLYNVTEYINKK